MINPILGDSRFFWPENLSSFIRIPYSWDSSLNTGIGINDTNTLWITSYLNLTSTFSILGLSWTQILLIFWVVPIVIISFLSSFFLFKKATGIGGIYSFLSGIIFTSNTYFLLVLLGGQLGVAFSYAFIPLVFLVFTNVIEKPRIRGSIIAGLIISLQILFDPRFAALTLLAVFFFYILRFKFNLKDAFLIWGIPAIIILLLHLFWVLPLIVYRSTIVPAGYESIVGAQFLSFAKFENTISLLHPNWPENIFGKTYFMRVEFLFLPIFAFLSIFFLKKEKSERRQMIIFLSLLALLSIFFAKGSNDPFGEIYLFAFDKIPGFSLFRDSTKLYSLIALSFSVLIPYSLYNLSNRLFKKSKIPILGILFLFFWVFSIRLLLNSTSRFSPHVVPEDYVLFKNFIINQNEFFRTLWIPDWQRYGYFSDNNPGVGRQELLVGSLNKQIKTLSEKNVITSLRSFWSIKYIVIPLDTNEELFLEDRKYSSKKYLETLGKLRKIVNLKEIDCCKGVKVFELEGESFGRFYTLDKKNLSYLRKNPAHYILNVKDVKKGDSLLFSESFDKNWEARIYKNEKRVKSKPQSTFKRFSINSFLLPKEGSYKIEIYYKPQYLVNLGLITSLTTLVFLLVIILRKH